MFLLLICSDRTIDGGHSAEACPTILADRQGTYSILNTQICTVLPAVTWLIAYELGIINNNINYNNATERNAIKIP